MGLEGLSSKNGKIEPLKQKGLSESPCSGHSKSKESDTRSWGLHFPQAPQVTLMQMVDGPHIRKHRNGWLDPLTLRPSTWTGSNWKALLLRNHLQGRDYRDVPIAKWLTVFVCLSQLP